MNNIKTVFNLDRDQTREEAVCEAAIKIRQKFYPDFDGKLTYAKKISGDRTFFFTYSEKTPGLYATGFVDFTERAPRARALRYRFRLGKAASLSDVSILPDVSDESAWKVAVDYQMDMDWAGAANASAQWEFRYDKSNHDMSMISHKSQGDFLLTGWANDDEEDIEEAYVAAAAEV